MKDLDNKTNTQIQELQNQWRNSHKTLDDNNVQRSSIALA